jgi:hypothetical protein
VQPPYASVSFEAIPLLTAAALADPNLVDKLLDNVAAAQRPIMIQCNTATRAGLPYMLHKAKTEKLSSASAVQAAAAMTPPLRFTARAEFCDALAGRVGTFYLTHTHTPRLFCSQNQFN